jgi:P-type conjugative transfer protein TrbG
LKPLPGGKSPPEPKDPKQRITQANAAARVQPVRNGFINAVQVYPFSSGALHQVYAAPGQVTDVALQPGEELVGSGPVAAGDTVRWIIGDTESGTGAEKQIHTLVKPTRPDLQTNLVINTDRRTYLLELNSTEKTYMASVSWQYPQDQLIALRRQNAAALTAQPVAAGIDISALNFRYEIARTLTSSACSAPDKEFLQRVVAAGPTPYTAPSLGTSTAEPATGVAAADLERTKPPIIPVGHQGK